MSCFTTMTATAAGADLDLTKHVNYTAGMILGVDDFTQEFAYLSGRDRWLAREAVGYGTISGLCLGVEKDGPKGWRVIIAPGVAISPRGQMICVSSAQCAYLNQWLAAADLEELQEHIKNADITSPPITSPPAGGDELSLYVVLCYRDCPTDNVPIPGEPCRNENELSAASRIKDDFSLELRFAPPKQAEEEAVKKFAAWLRQIEVVESGASTELAYFENAIRERWLSPPASPPVITSPPTDLQINKSDVAEYLRTAFRIWVTELRSVLSERKTGCSVEMTSGGKLEDCVLLGEIKVALTDVSPGWKVSDTTDPQVIEKNRPYLVHLRMLQEWILGGDISYDETGMPITSPPIGVLPDILPPAPSLDNLSDVALPSPLTDGQVLMFRNGSWTAETPTPTPTPTDTRFLILPLATVTRREQAVGNRPGVFYEVWMNIDAPGNLAEVLKLNPELLSIVAETNTDTSSPQTFLTSQIDYDLIPKQFKNVFTLQLKLQPRQAEPNFMRFRFNMVERIVSFRGREISLAEYAERNGIKFSGYLEGKFATVFVRGAELKLG